MKHINIKVIPRAKHNKIVEEKDRLKVYLTAPAQDNKANEALIKMLADYYNIRKSRIKIISGQLSRNKMVEIE